MYARDVNGVENGEDFFVPKMAGDSLLLSLVLNRGILYIFGDVGSGVLFLG